MIIILFVFIVPTIGISLETQTKDLLAAKITPASAFFILDKSYREGDFKTTYRVLLEFSDKDAISDENPECFLNSSIFKNFCIADVAINDIFRLAQKNTIRQVYILNQARLNTDTDDGSKQIVIGIIDRGFDWKNKCFMKENGKESRIIYLWDQNAKAIQPVGTGIPYGVEYRKQDIQASLNSPCNLIPLEAGHGWIIAAIAAGNVIIRDAFNNQLFPGKFTEFPIIMVNTTGKMDALVDAVAYITRKTAQMNSRCIINFAYSKHTGPHEPDDIYLRAIDALLDENSLLVVAAGNEGMKNIYTRMEISSHAQLEFDLIKNRFAGEKNDKPRRIEIEAWYGGPPLDRISIISPNGKVYAVIGKNEHCDFDSPDGILYIANVISNPALIKKNSLIVSISSSLAHDIPDGRWVLVLEKSSRSQNTTIDAWITKSERCEAEFKNHDPSKNTISFLAFGKKVISVGSWIHGSNNIITEADYSNNACKNRNCSSPLPGVLAAGSIKVDIPGYTESMFQDGTSVSTALVSRYIACIWKDNPGLKAPDFKKNLNGMALVFGPSSYQWKGLPIYRPVNISNNCWFNSNQI